MLSTFKYNFNDIWGGGLLVLVNILKLPVENGEKQIFYKYFVCIFNFLKEISHLHLVLNKFF